MGILESITNHSLIVPSSLKVDPSSIQLDAILSLTSFNLLNKAMGCFCFIQRLGCYFTTRPFFALVANQQT
jgi:hypothetical protein